MVLSKIYTSCSPGTKLKKQNNKTGKYLILCWIFLVFFYSQWNHFFLFLFGKCKYPQCIDCWFNCTYTFIHWKTEHHDEKWTTAALMYSISKYKGNCSLHYIQWMTYFTAACNFIDYPRRRPFTCDAEKKSTFIHTIQYNLSVSLCAKVSSF